MLISGKHALVLSCSVALVTLLGCCSCLQQNSTQTRQEAPLGAYLGCYDLQHLKALPGIRETRGAPHTPGTLHECPAACRESNYTITIISPQLQCWCMLATPNTSHHLRDSACNAGGPGAAVFYQHDLAATHKCKVVPTPLTADAISVDYNQHNVEFTPPTAAAAAGNASELPAQMRIRMEGSSGARVQPKAPRQLFGQFEVTAKVADASGAVTAFYVRDSDEYNQENSGDFEEIDVEFLNASPGVPHSVWFNSYHRGLSRGERLTKPESYQQLLNLSAWSNNTNTWLTYTFTWQPSHVIWAINGVPLLRRTTGETVRWSDMKGKPFERTFVSPDRPMHMSFSMWNDNSRFHFGGELDNAKSLFYSYFRELRRIACSQPFTANDTDVYRSGPAYLYAEASAWPKLPVPAYSPPPPPPSPSPSPAPAPSTEPNPKVAAAASAPGGKSEANATAVGAEVKQGSNASSATAAAPAAAAANKVQPAAAAAAVGAQHGDNTTSTQPAASPAVRAANSLTAVTPGSPPQPSPPPATATDTVHVPTALAAPAAPAGVEVPTTASAGVSGLAAKKPGNAAPSSSSSSAAPKAPALTPPPAPAAAATPGATQTVTPPPPQQQQQQVLTAVAASFAVQVPPSSTASAAAAVASSAAANSAQPKPAAASASHGAPANQGSAYKGVGYPWQWVDHAPGLEPQAQQPQPQQQQQLQQQQQAQPKLLRAVSVKESTAITTSSGTTSSSSTTASSSSSSDVRRPSHPLQQRSRRWLQQVQEVLQGGMGQQQQQQDGGLQLAEALGAAW